MVVRGAAGGGAAVSFIQPARQREHTVHSAGSWRMHWSIYNRGRAKLPNTHIPRIQFTTQTLCLRSPANKHNTHFYTFMFVFGAEKYPFISLAVNYTRAICVSVCCLLHAGTGMMNCFFEQNACVHNKCSIFLRSCSSSVAEMLLLLLHSCTLSSHSTQSI